MKESNEKPVIALTLGDPAGIGPELIARLLARRETLAQANVVLVGDAWLWEDGQRIAGVRIGCDPVAGFDEVRQRSDTSRAAFLAVDTVQPAQVHRARAEAAGGASVLAVLEPLPGRGPRRPHRRDLLRAAEQVRDETGRPEARRRAAPFRRLSRGDQLLLRVQHARFAVDGPGVVACAAEGRRVIPVARADRRRHATDPRARCAPMASRPRASPWQPSTRTAARAAPAGARRSTSSRRRCAL